jgi:hypothetical protein
MAIDNINRQPIQQSLTAAGSINVDTNVLLCDATAGAFTVAPYSSPGDGALHQVVVQKSDATSNAVLISDGTFSYSLTAQGDVVTIRLNEAGAWFGVAGFDASGTGDVEGPASAVSANLASFSGTTGKIIQDSGVASSAVALAASSLRASLAADVTNATATMSNLTGLSLTVVAGGVYSGRAVFKCADSTAAEGIAFDFDGGAATMTAFAAGAGLLTGGTTVASVTVSSALATDLVWTTITGETWLTVELSFTANAGGTFIPRFAQGTAHTSGTATVSRGSSLTLNRVS